MNELINIHNDNGTLTVSSREVAEHFEKRHCDVLRDADNLISKMEPTQNCVRYFIGSEYIDSKGETRREYLLTRDGFSLLVMGFTGKAALEWKLKYISAFNEMERQIKEQVKPMSPIELIAAQAQALVGIEKKQKEHDLAIEDTNKRIDGIKDVVSLNTQSWREDARRLIVKISYQMGGPEYIRDVQAEVFNLVNIRGAVNLATRLTNKRRRMADEGVCKSKRDKLTKVDIIAEDKKLIEIYVAIVKEMAIKYGACVA